MNTRSSSGRISISLMVKTNREHTMSQDETFTVSELMRTLRRMQREGKGDLPVYVHRYGDTHCMPAIRVRQYDEHVVVAAPNPALLWPNGEQEAVCSNAEAMFENEADRDNAYACRESGCLL